MSGFPIATLRNKTITEAEERMSRGVGQVSQKCDGCEHSVSVDEVQGSSASGPFGLRLPFQITYDEMRVSFLAATKFGDPKKLSICLGCATPEVRQRVGVPLPEPSSSDRHASQDAGTTALSSPMDSDDQPAEPEATAAFGAHVCRTLLWLLACAIAAAAGCAL
jgi:hypothetical protein